MPRNFPSFLGVAAHGDDHELDLNDDEEDDNNDDNNKDSEEEEEEEKELQHHPEKRKYKLRQELFKNQQKQEKRAQHQQILNTVDSIPKHARARFLHLLRSTLDSVVDAAMASVDPCFDQWTATQFISQRLPVALTTIEEGVSAAGAPHAQIYPYTRLRMLRPGIASVAVEAGKVIFDFFWMI